MKKQSNKIDKKTAQPIDRHEQPSSHKPSFTEFLLICPQLDNWGNPFQRHVEYPREADLIGK
jgi:hypothetical protein